MIRTFRESLPLDNEEIARLLSDNRRRSGFSNKLKDQVEELKADARRMLRPQAAFEYYATDELPPRPCFAEAVDVALALCTIGPELPATADRLMREGELVQGVILDAIGSTAAESLAEEVNKLIDKEADRRGVEATTRYSPGYCGWALSDQNVFFRRLPAQELGVDLTESFLMLPVKSVTFAVNLGPEVLSSNWENRCQTCREVGCPYRRS